MLFVNEHFTAGIVYGVGETHPSEVAGLTTITFMEVCTVHWPWYGNIFGLVFFRNFDYTGMKTRVPCTCRTTF